MEFSIDTSLVKNLPLEEQIRLGKLIDSFNAHIYKNLEKNRYYEGKISLSEVNLGIALPKGIHGLEIGCSWGAKTVDVLAARSMFDGFVGINGEDIEQLDHICVSNNLVAEYMKACRDELKYGCTFVTLSQDDEIGCKIRFHSPRTASAKWDGEKNQIECGFAIIDSPPNNDDPTWQPALVNYYTDEAVWVLERNESLWTATEYPHIMGRPLMEALVWNATSDKPFGRSRIKGPVRELIKGYVRTVANAAIGLEFSTAPQKYILGVTDEQYDKIIENKFKQYVGNIMAATWNPEAGEKPTFGQLPQGSITPHVDMLRLLATQFSATTGLTVSDTGVVNDANPTSAEAILAQSQTLIKMAEQLNTGNGNSLKNVAIMALAISQDISMDQLPNAQYDIVAHFKNPAMPSVAMTADAALKIASVRPGFAQTDVFAEMIGFDKADIRRIKAQERMAQGLELVASMEGE
jgi:hypothetical protein